MLAIEYHVYIWQVFENFAYREINERRFSNPHLCHKEHKERKLSVSTLVNIIDSWLIWDSSHEDQQLYQIVT